jgi:hypothetical protein
VSRPASPDLSGRPATRPEAISPLGMYVGMISGVISGGLTEAQAGAVADRDFA